MLIPVISAAETYGAISASRSPCIFRLFFAFRTLPRKRRLLFYFDEDVRRSVAVFFFANLQRTKTVRSRFLNVSFIAERAYGSGEIGLIFFFFAQFCLERYFIKRLPFYRNSYFSNFTPYFSNFTPYTTNRRREYYRRLLLCYETPEPSSPDALLSRRPREKASRSYRRLDGLTRTRVFYL